jgi:hypothetical protein
MSDLDAVDIDLACLKERNNYAAVRHGLPPIGATLTNAHGIQWIVDGHTYAPSMATLGVTESDCDPRDLYPVSIPQNLSQRLEDMFQELHRCTPKEFVPLDTVPHLRPDQSMPFGHSVDSGSDPNRILFFLDVARIHEAVFAHELAHVWVELVEGIEDFRVLEDRSDPVRYSQVQRIQSFVLDFRVNDVIRSKGFDTFELENDRVKSLEQLSIAVTNGYVPPTKWESVVMAMLLAEVFIETTNALAHSDDIFGILRTKLTDEWALAEDLAAIVKDEPRNSTDSVKRCIDKVLILCFAFANEHLDLEKDLIERPTAIEWRDKWPEWLPGLAPQQKCEIGKAMARSGLSGNAKIQLSNSMSNAAVQFSLDGEVWTEPIALPFRFAEPTCPDSAAIRIMEINEQNRRSKMSQLERMRNGVPRRRGYATGEARFITQVRMQEMLAGEHPYAYAMCNPITYTDPSGLQPNSGLQKRHKIHEFPYNPGGIGGGLDYGNYCGPAVKKNPAWHVLPVDCVDACCLNHDRCLEAQYGAGVSQLVAHACCDSGLSDCVGGLFGTNCCKSSPDEGACLYAMQTISIAFWVLGNANPPPPPGWCVPPNQWLKYSRINWGGPGQCQNRSIHTHWSN